MYHNNPARAFGTYVCTISQATSLLLLQYLTVKFVDERGINLLVSLPDTCVMCIHQSHQWSGQFLYFGKRSIYFAKWSIRVLCVFAILRLAELNVLKAN